MKSKKFLFLSILLCFCAGSAMAQQASGRMQYCVTGHANMGLFTGSAAIDVSAGWRFNDRHYLGVGTGYHGVEVADDAGDGLSNGFVPYIPLFFDYINYHPLKRHPQHQFYKGIEAGGIYFPDKLSYKDDSYPRFDLHLRAKIGWEFALTDKLGLNVGFNYMLPPYPAFGISLGVRF